MKAGLAGLAGQKHGTANVGPQIAPQIAPQNGLAGWAGLGWLGWAGWAGWLADWADSEPLGASGSISIDFLVFTTLPETLAKPTLNL